MTGYTYKKDHDEDGIVEEAYVNVRAPEDETNTLFHPELGKYQAKCRDKTDLPNHLAWVQHCNGGRWKRSLNEFKWSHKEHHETQIPEKTR